MKSTIILCLLSFHPTFSFLIGNNNQNNYLKINDQTLCHSAAADVTAQTSLCMSNNHNNPNLNRRSVLSNTAKILPAVTFLSSPFPTLANEEGKGKVVLFGGSGYVGAHVAQLLSSQGYTVTSVSRKSPSDQETKIAQILGITTPLTNVECTSADAINDDLTPLVQNAVAVVSCVGVAPGGPNQIAGNGIANVRIAQAAKDVGNVDRFVYISVDSALAAGPAKFVLGDYFKGKAQAEAAVLKAFGGDEKKALVIKPGIIAGAPPGEIRPPGPPGAKAVSVDKVARAVVMGVTGEKSGVVDGNAAIESL